MATPSASSPAAQSRKSRISFFTPDFWTALIRFAISCDLPLFNASTRICSIPSSSILSLTGGIVTMSRVTTTFCGSDLRALTTDKFTLEPGSPVSMLRICASDISRVLLPSIASRMSVSCRPALSAGPPGITATTEAYPKRFDTAAPTSPFEPILRALYSLYCSGFK